MKNKRKYKKGSIWITLGLTLMAAALFLTIFNFWDENRAFHSAALAKEQLESITEETTAEEMVIPDYILNPDMEMPVKEVGGYDYIGLLEIPPCDLVLPVIDQWSYPALKIAPCRYAGSAYKDDLVIAAHNYKSHFGRISALQPGDILTFTDTDQNIFRYKVVGIEILQPTDIKEMTSGDYDLTLFTCNYSGQSRVTVRCDRILGE